ncbi:unnamed protein product [Brachionus calyciflorus]|uniref:LIM zinc-binding domain-containing protein n=1 Tax=Brachionus calyciflorus TaxID=104777 RepID=A0A813P2D5_9BILA|nr:unnamed protein product [Brachionus calyciflorus]
MNPLNPQPQVISTKPKITFSPSKQAVTDFKPYQPVSPPQYHPIQQTDNHRPQPTFKPAYQPPTHPVPPPIKAPQQPTGTRNFTRGNKGSALFNLQNHGPSQPQCTSCYQVIRGPFISAVGKIWCPNHFICANPSCGVSLHEIGFVEENGKLYCEKDFETYFAPKCAKCSHTILGECCYALEKTYHSECFVCAKCKQTIGSGNFHIEDGVPYCERDFNALFSTKCAGCQFPIEAGDKFVEALIEKWHVECFICTKCNLPLSGGFAVKGNKPFCKKHAY